MVRSLKSAIVGVSAIANALCTVLHCCFIISFHILKKLSLAWDCGRGFDVEIRPGWKRPLPRRRCHCCPVDPDWRTVHRQTRWPFHLPPHGSGSQCRAWGTYWWRWLCSWAPLFGRSWARNKGGPHLWCCSAKGATRTLDGKSPQGCRSSQGYSAPRSWSRLRNAKLEKRGMD